MANKSYTIAVRSAGYLGLVMSALTTVRLVIELVQPEQPNGLTQVFLADFQDLWKDQVPDRKPLTAEDADLLATYTLFSSFTCICYTMLIIATHVRKRWSFVLWLLFEILSLMWQINYLIALPLPTRYAPGILDLVCTTLNIGMGLFLIHQTKPPGPSK